MDDSKTVLCSLKFPWARERIFSKCIHSLSTYRQTVSPACPKRFSWGSETSDKDPCCHRLVGFDALTAMLQKIRVLWDAAPCQLVNSLLRG